MHIKELTLYEFDDYASNHPLKSYHQSSSYALLMSENGYDFDFIGLLDANDKIVAASLILKKKIALNFFYGYAPKGLLVDYFNENLVEKFILELKNHYYKKNMIFIRINPEIAIGELQSDNNYLCKYNENTKIINTFSKFNLKIFNKSENFETILPRFNAIVNLKKFDITNIDKTARNKVKKGIRRGLVFEKSTLDNIDILYGFIKGMKNRDISYYKSYYNKFNKNDQIDLIYIKISYHDYLVNAQNSYNEELEVNNYLNELFKINQSQDILNKKMISDKLLTMHEKEIVEATKCLQNNITETYIAGALVIKYHNRINIVISGFDKKYKKFNPNHYLYYSILEHYKKDFSFADLNGVTNDFSNKTNYYGLNKFKLEFKPKIYEFIGEADIIINEKEYLVLNKTKVINKLFKKN